MAWMPQVQHTRYAYDSISQFNREYSRSLANRQCENFYRLDGMASGMLERQQ